jgi:hypothetical protein
MMIHPSTMAGPTWFTGSFGTTNPFQQSGSPFFRNPQFQNQQSGFWPGNHPFQSSQTGFGFASNPFPNPTFGIGTNTTQMQNTINEIVRQTIPTVLASFGFQPGNTFQSPFGQQTPFGTQFRNVFPNNPFTDWQTQNTIMEITRQATNQAIQNVLQQNPNAFTQNSWGQNQPFFSFGTTSFTGASNPFETATQQQIIGNIVAQACQQACWQVCQTIAQTATTCIQACLAQQNQTFTSPFQTFSTPFQTPNQPFNFNNTTSQFGVTTGIPTGAGAF